MIDDPRPRGEPTLVVGVGASAGGLQACKALLGSLPKEQTIAIVIVMHLDPTHPSHVAEILQRGTAARVVQADRSQRLEGGCVYVIAPATSLRVVGGSLQVDVLDNGRPIHPIDQFFSSLGTHSGQRAVGIVLSGTGDDGAAGLRDIASAGGLVLVQAPETAEHREMPEMAIASADPRFVVSPEQMVRILLDHVDLDAPTEEPSEPGLETAPAFDGILDLLTGTFGVNFRQDYKRGTLARRTARRILLKQDADADAYLDRLHHDPEEVAALYRDLLIGVTAFFRDPEVWHAVEKEILPRIAARHDDSTPLRIWVPGCATGEEAYTLAMLAIEQVGPGRRPFPVQVFATDVAESALTVARRGVYPESHAAEIGPERIARFFQRVPDGYRIVREVRDLVIFSRHDLLVDPPFSRVDLVSCRNVLIYFGSHARHRVLELFHFALNPGGMLLLGTSEVVARNRERFEVVSKDAHAYRAVEETGTTLGRASARTPFRFAPGPTPSHTPPKVGRMLEQVVLTRYTRACVVVSESFEILSFYGPTSDYLVQPTGAARMDLLSWARPGLYPGLRAALDRARTSTTRIEGAELRLELDGVTQRVECTIERVALPGEERRFIVAFRSLPAPVPALPLREEPHDGSAAWELEAELRASREELYDTVEQLESSTEAYRSSHEELLSLNEELQSNNEELEASKEELQSLNEEMNTINRQLEEKNAELRVLNADLSNLLSSTDIPILFLDRALCVRRYTTPMTGLLRIVPGDLGRNIQHIKPCFQDDDLLPDCRQVLAQLTAVKRDVRADDGRWFTRSVSPYRTEDDAVEGVCVAFHEVTGLKAASAEAEAARLYAEAIVATVRTPLVVMSEDLRVVSANDAFHRMLDTDPDQVTGKSLFELDGGQWDVPALRKLLQAVLPVEDEVVDFDLEHVFVRLGHRILSLNARRMRHQGTADHLLLSIEDVTDRRMRERSAVGRADELERERLWRNDFLALLGHELRNPLAALTHGLNLLGRYPDDPDRREEIRATMARQAGRIAGILDQLLDVARLTARKIRMDDVPLDLREAVSAAVEGASTQFDRRHQQLHLAIADGPVVVRGDVNRLTQAVENLLTNAAKYTDDGGEVWVTLDLDGPSARLSVRDAGVGIDPNILPHLFEPFVQAPRTLDRAEGGLGLGLALVREVVELHGGTVTAASSGRGFGSEFLIVLPLTDEPLPPPAPAAVPTARRSHRVLLVDDETEAASMLAEILALEGHQTRCASDGPSALQATRAFAPDVVLLDLGLPGEDGYEVARQLRGTRPMQLVALTGYGRDDARLRASSFDHFLLKPPDIGRLTAWLAHDDLGEVPL